VEELRALSLSEFAEKYLKVNGGLPPRLHPYQQAFMDQAAAMMRADLRGHKVRRFRFVMHDRVIIHCTRCGKDWRDKAMQQECKGDR
jgi:hypothetical protein